MIHNGEHRWCRVVHKFACDKTMHTVVVLRAIRVGHIHRKVPFGIEVLTEYLVLRIEHHTVWADFVPPPEILSVHC